MRKCLLIINPCSGKQLITGEQRISVELLDIIKILNEHNYSVNVQVTLYHNHAREIAASCDADLIICTGGDGTLSQVIAGVIDQNAHIPIGYIPRGSTNDYANTMNISSDYKKALMDIINGHPHLVDVGKFGDNEYFNYVASFGLFTAASYNTPQEMKNLFGNVAYFFGGIADLANTKTYKLTIKANGEEYSGEYILGLVLNTTSVAGILKLDAANVDLSDGLFEVILIKAPKDLNDYNKIFDGFMNCNFNDSIFTFVKSSEIELFFDDTVSWSLDGEGKSIDKYVKIQNLKERNMFQK
jgi:YegS/Rv2252/BmrU family lipid kinase